MVEQDAIVELLCRRDAYEDNPTSVEHRETHISHVFLTDTFAYKLKKPVKFDFLDFTSCDKRRDACEAEITLNCRLAADVYLAVVPITQDDGLLQVDGRGEAVDWIVKMRRLRDDQNLEKLIARGEIHSLQLDRIAEFLAAFYRNQPKCVLGRDDYRNTVEQHVRDNRLELLQLEHYLPESFVHRVHAAQLQYLRTQARVFNERSQSPSHIVDGHGDLRPEHIYLTPEPLAIDCIEFNAEFRKLDVADELSFLEMECEQLDAKDIGRHITSRCLELLDDEPPPELLDFYMSYRACVRSKVAALRSQQLPLRNELGMDARAREYLDIADHHARKLPPPLLIVVRGLMGSGKSTLAHALAEAIDAEHFETDSIRKELFGASDSLADYNQNIYEPENRRAVYGTMFARAEQHLRARMPVVLDGTFLSRKLQTEAASLAKKMHSHPLIVNCNCPASIAIERIAARRKTGAALSEARTDLYSHQQRDQEKTPAELRHVAVDTTQAVETNVRYVFDSCSNR